ncbi:MAG: RNA polymerase sigma factor [Muribaculaceae bacterium]|nr:RNA polymerase sigma factor [Muribaculaceae bacterium]
MSERDISRGCKQGKANAQRALFDRYSPILMAKIFSYVGNDDDAKDVLQDTFIKAYTTIDRFAWAGDGSLQAWLTRIAVNTAINFLRSRKRLVVTTVSATDMDDPPDVVEEATVDEVNRLDTSTILEMVAELPDGYRTVFNLYCLDGYSHKEIAEQLGINEKSSSSQLARAKALLAQKIKKYLNEQNNDYHYEQQYK